MFVYEDGSGTPFTVLRTPTPESYSFLFSLAMEAGTSWPWGGQPPSFETFPGTIWRDAYANALIVARENSQSLGYAELYDVNLHHGTGFIRAYFSESSRGLLRRIEGLLFFIDQIFTRVPIRILYFESAAERAQQYFRATILEEEARFRDRLRRAMTYEDLVVYRMTSSMWESSSQRFLRRRINARGEVIS